MAVINEFDYLCRLCGIKTDIMTGLPIFEAGDRMRNIEKKIAACLPVQVSISDQLPKLICEQCAFKLDEMFDFHEKTLHTEELLMAMLKGMKTEEVIHINDMNQMQIQTEIDNIHHDISDISSNMNNIQTNECGGVHLETNDSTIHTMKVMDDIDLVGGEQVVSQVEIGQQESNIEVTEIGCLDGNTVRLVDEHMQDVSNHQITMHLDGDMTVVGNITVDEHLGINYVTTINSDAENPEQIVHYCTSEADPLLLDSLTAVENSTHTTDTAITNDDSDMDDSRASDVETPLISSDTMPSTSRETEKSPEIMVEYTKKTKDTLIENILHNPTVDEMSNNWYICPFCNEASTEPSNIIEHFDQHFCSCSCGLYFTSVEEFHAHEEECSIDKPKSSRRMKKVQVEELEVLDAIESIAEGSSGIIERRSTARRKTQSSNVRQKWTPKECAECGKQYRTNYKLQEHMRKHTGEKPFQCSMCEKAFRSKIGLAQHTATHTGQFDYSCSTCGKGFQCKSYLIVHQRVHSDLKPYPCSTCGQNFKTKQSLLDHENRHLGVKPYICEICGRGFITKGLCKSHQKIHSGMDNRQYPCMVCNKMFVSKSYLNTHLRIHTGEKPYLCEVCGKGFLTRVDLKIHSTMHTGEKSFKCEMCNKVFARRAALRCHRRSHTGERPYRCDVCGKTFTQFSPMAIHKRLHTGERPYECDVCAKTFVSRSTMMCHRKKHHATAATTDKDASVENNDTVEVNGDVASPIVDGESQDDGTGD